MGKKKNKKKNSKTGATDSQTNVSLVSEDTLETTAPPTPVIDQINNIEKDDDNEEVLKTVDNTEEAIQTTNVVQAMEKEEQVNNIDKEEPSTPPWTPETTGFEQLDPTLILTDSERKRGVKRTISVLEATSKDVPTSSSTKELERSTSSFSTPPEIDLFMTSGTTTTPRSILSMQEDFSFPVALSPKQQPLEQQQEDVEKQSKEENNSFESELRLFYETFNESNLHLVSRLAEQYHGNLKELKLRLLKKYNLATSVETADSDWTIALQCCVDKNQLAKEEELLQNQRATKDEEEEILNDPNQGIEEISKEEEAKNKEIFEKDLIYFYSRFNPKKISNVPSLVNKYFHDQKEFKYQLLKKYESSLFNGSRETIEEVWKKEMDTTENFTIFEQELTQFYSKFNPTKLSMVKSFITKDSEYKLKFKLLAKYGLLSLQPTNETHDDEIQYIWKQSILGLSKEKNSSSITNIVPPAEMGVSRSLTPPTSRPSSRLSSITKTRPESSPQVIIVKEQRQAIFPKEVNETNGSLFYRNLKRFYDKYNPEKANSVDELAVKYQNEQDVLKLKLLLKYLPNFSMYSILIPYAYHHQSNNNNKCLFCVAAEYPTKQVVMVDEELAMKFQFLFQNDLFPIIDSANVCSCDQCHGFGNNVLYRFYERFNLEKITQVDYLVNKYQKMELDFKIQLLKKYLILLPKSTFQEILLLYGEKEDVFKEKPQRENPPTTNQVREEIQQEITQNHAFEDDNGQQESDMATKNVEEAGKKEPEFTFGSSYNEHQFNLDQSMISSVGGVFFDAQSPPSSSEGSSVYVTPIAGRTPTTPKKIHSNKKKTSPRSIKFPSFTISPLKQEQFPLKIDSLSLAENKGVDNADTSQVRDEIIEEEHNAEERGDNEGNKVENEVTKPVFHLLDMDTLPVQFEVPNCPKSCFLASNLVNLRLSCTIPICKQISKLLEERQVLMEKFRQYLKKEIEETLLTNDSLDNHLKNLKFQKVKLFEIETSLLKRKPLIPPISKEQESFILERNQIRMDMYHEEKKEKIMNNNNLIDISKTVLQQRKTNKLADSQDASVSVDIENNLKKIYDSYLDLEHSLKNFSRLCDLERNQLIELCQQQNMQTEIQKILRLIELEFSSFNLKEEENWIVRLKSLETIMSKLKTLKSKLNTNVDEKDRLEMLIIQLSSSPELKEEIEFPEYFYYVVSRQ